MSVARAGLVIPPPAHARFAFRAIWLAADADLAHQRMYGREGF
jgi:hypothetical protein